MSAIMAMAPCFGCGSLFTFNPDKVPSIPICSGCGGSAETHKADCERTYELVRQPICQDCVNRVNPIRIQGGFEPIRVLPGAYDPQVIE